MRLTGRAAMVTGAARGIGAAIAGALAADGAHVAVCDLDLAAATSTSEALANEHGNPTMAVQLDVADRASVNEAVETSERNLAPLDILVNNAGIDVIQPFMESTEETWGRLIAVNLKGPINTCHAVLPGMLTRGSGKIVNIGSDAGRVGSSGEAVYSATKGGVIAFTKTLAREVASKSINVNCVCPGPTDTALLDQVAAASQKLYDSLARAIPLRRIALPTDIAPVVAFLVSDDAGYITGQTLSVSGGLTMC